MGGHEATVRSLPATAAGAAMPVSWRQALAAALASSEAAAQLLLAAAPAAAMVRYAAGRLSSSRADMWKQPMQCCQPLRPISSPGCHSSCQPLFTDVACQRPVSRAGRNLVPTLCAGLGTALPVVACRSRADVRQLVRRLLPAERLCLRASALSSPASCLQLRVLPSWCTWCNKGRSLFGWHHNALACCPAMPHKRSRVGHRSWRMF